MLFNGEYDLLYKSMTSPQGNPVFKVKFHSYDGDTEQSEPNEPNRLDKEKDSFEFKLGDKVQGETEDGKVVVGVVKKVNTSNSYEGSVIVYSETDNRRYKLDPTTVTDNITSGVTLKDISNRDKSFTVKKM